MPLRRDEVIDEALALLDEVGLDGLTTRGLTQRLGVQRGALYWHVASKKELLDAVADRIGAELLAAPIDGTDWAERVAAFARLVRTTMLGHRDGARVVVGAIPTPTLADAADRLTGILRAADAPERTAGLMTDLLMSHIAGFVLQEQSSDTAPDDETFAAEVAIIINGFRVELGDADAAAERVEAH